MIKKTIKVWYKKEKKMYFVGIINFREERIFIHDSRNNYLNGEWVNFDEVGQLNCIAKQYE